jgi:hypothetical protein
MTARPTPAPPHRGRPQQTLEQLLTRPDDVAEVVIRPAWAPESAPVRWVRRAGKWFEVAP